MIKKMPINNIDVISAKAEELKLDNIAEKKLPWIETLTYTTPAPVEIKDVFNDLERESVFMKIAFEAAQECQKRVKDAGVAFWRPEDYFAEMFKSDDHMEKIRIKLLDEAKSLKKSEEARKMREVKKYGKQIQQQKLEERRKEKVETLARIDMIKKSKRSLNADDNDFDIELMKEEGQPQKKKQKTGLKKNKSREVKDKKFGFGGKKRHLKTNTSESTNDFSFNPHKNKAPFGAMKTKAKPQRPGKSKRVARKFK